MRVCGLQSTRMTGIKLFYMFTAHACTFIEKHTTACTWYMYMYMYYTRIRQSVDSLYCTCTLNRWDMTVPETTYTSPPPIGKARTLESLQTNCRHSRPALHLGSKYSPLLPLEPSQYVLDELHLLLRVADVLVRNIINLADHMDQTQSLRQGRAGTHIPQLEEMVKSCGVPFKISRVSTFYF